MTNKIFTYLLVLAIKVHNDGDDSNSPSGSSEDIQSSGNSSLNLSEQGQEEQCGDKRREEK